MTVIAVQGPHVEIRPHGCGSSARTSYLMVRLRSYSSSARILYLMFKLHGCDSSARPQEEVITEKTLILCLSSAAAIIAQGPLIVIRLHGTVIVQGPHIKIRLHN